MEILYFLAGAAVLAAGYLLAKWPERNRTKESASVQPNPEPEVQPNDITSPEQAIAEAYGVDVDQARRFHKYNGRPPREE